MLYLLGDSTSISGKIAFNAEKINHWQLVTNGAFQLKSPKGYTTTSQILMKIGVHGEFGAKPPKLVKKIIFDQRPPRYGPPKLAPPSPDPLISNGHNSTTKSDRLVKLYIFSNLMTVAFK